MQNMRLENVVSVAQYAKENRVDYVVERGSITARTKDGIPVLDVEGVSDFLIRDYAHGQIAEKLGIPQAYYNKMLSAGKTDLLCENINTWLLDAKSEKNMLRTLDGSVRAVVSSRFRCLDNYDLLFLTLDELKKLPAVEIKQSYINDTNLYLKAILPSVVGDVVNGDLVNMGIVVRNSEVGAGALRVEPFFWRQVCSNGAISSTAMRQVHVGGDKGVGYYSDETAAKASEVVWLKVRDMIRATADGRVLQDYLADARKAAGIELKKPVEVVERVGLEAKLTEGIRKDILNHFVHDGDSTVWGVSNAITRTAQDQEDIAKQIELEELGYRVMVDLTKKLKPEDIDFSAGVQQ